MAKEWIPVVLGARMQTGFVSLYYRVLSYRGNGGVNGVNALQ